MYRMKTKTTREVLEKIAEGFIQSYGIPKVISSDHASAFRSKEFYLFCTCLGIKLRFTNITASHCRGRIESTIKKMRATMRKMTFTLQEDEINLELIPLLTSLSLNGSISPLHNERPSVLLCGHDFSQIPNIMEKEVGFVPTMIKTSDMMKHRQKHIKKMIERARNIAEEHHKESQKQRNKHAVDSTFEKGKILFHKDMSKTPIGTLSKPLRAYYRPTPLVCLQSNTHSSLTLRPMDNTVAWYCNNTLKEYNNRMRENFPDIPENILKIFEINFQEWTQEDIDNIALHIDIEEMPPIDLEALREDYPYLDEDLEDDDEEPVSYTHLTLPTKA